MTEIIINLSCDQVYFLLIMIVAMELISLLLDFQNHPYLRTSVLNKDVWRLNIKA